MELIADGHFVHAAFQVSGYDLADGEEPCFENVVVYTGEDENAQDGWVNMSGSFYDGIVSNNNESRSMKMELRLQAMKLVIL